MHFQWQYHLPYHTSVRIHSPLSLGFRVPNSCCCYSFHFILFILFFNLFFLLRIWNWNFTKYKWVEVGLLVLIQKLKIAIFYSLCYFLEMILFIYVPWSLYYFFYVELSDWRKKIIYISFIFIFSLFSSPIIGYWRWKKKSNSRDRKV